MANNIITTSLKLIDDKVKLLSEITQKPPILTDYFPPLGTIGESDGYIPLELILASFASCLSTTLLIIFRNQMKKSVTSLSADTKGFQRYEMPKIIEKIIIDINIESPDISDADFKEALKTAENICPVWAMLKGNVQIEINYNLSDAA